MASEDIGVHPLSLSKLFENSFYTIDYYQREYAWGEEEVRILIEDLVRTFHSWSAASEYRRRPDRAPQYFLGPFVYYEHSGTLRCLVDGQQRFTTLHLILMSLRNLGREYEKDKHDEILKPLIRKLDADSRPRYRIDIQERTKVLTAIFNESQYQPSQGDSLSVRNLWERSQDIAPLLRVIGPDEYPRFVRWLLDRVVMAGICAGNSNEAFRIFESMNDRGARLTPVDLLKSHLLSNVGTGEEQLNDGWRTMLAELTTARNDNAAPSQFLKAALQGKYARVGENDADMESIDTAVNLWVRRNEARLGLSDPEDYHSFVEQLIDWADKYRTFLYASRNLREGLEEVFYNERNGLGAQMIAIMATVGKRDAYYKEKARRVAAFIDRWYILGTLRESPAQQRDLLELICQLLPELRQCITPDDVSRVLAKQISEHEREDPVTLEGFGLRGTNRHQIKYLLARLTSYAMKGCGRRGDVDEYLSEAKPYQIEHLFANKPERHRDEVPDLLQFRTLRNQLGGLALLPATDNASLGAMPLHEKISRYGRQHVLLGVLDKDYHDNFTDLRKFAKNNEVEPLMRPFVAKESMAKVTRIRQDLYLTLCARIWALKNIGIDSKCIPAFRDPFSPAPNDVVMLTGTALPIPSKATVKTDLARMVRMGILQPATRIVMNHRGTDYWAEISADGRVRLESTGAVYTNVNDAGAIIRDTKTCDGMKFWNIRTGDGPRISLKQIREDARAAGTFPG